MTAPLFRDPVHDGATDPVLVWNRGTSEWWLIYTSRRAGAPGPGVAWVHGSDLGYATSSDGVEFTYRGTLQGLAFEPGHNTYWAPEVFWHDGRYHMYVSFIRGVPRTWTGHERTIHHCTSDDLLNWTHHGELPLSSRYCIDACVAELPGGGFRLWYKDEAADSSTWAVDSADLATWHSPRQVLSGPPHEGPNVFRFRGSWWMLTDEWCGQAVHRSDDLEGWERSGRILDVPGSRPDDARFGLHADVVVQGSGQDERAFVVYFTHPERDESGGPGTYDERSARERRSSVQIAPLDVVDGALVCDRDRDDAVLAPGP
ncbi:glycosyl hydrolase family 43 [Kineococcus xinjiangensis]|uniref:Glycosyl hydrolase family 43 n=1 Tax=Kineococcus xinjiangensis TaxID=512762 RepID=A0A2S6IT53_9ACTN|nr:family 43 glycosylhydrolase [Kineococcus xinjiangensis]PPK97432.1 glycosyl hydrolase family 43 [Kineococcus xinjiangensis]